MNNFEAKKARLKTLSEQMLCNNDIPTFVAPILQVSVVTSLEKLESESQIDEMLEKAKALIHFVETGEFEDEKTEDYSE